MRPGSSGSASAASWGVPESVPPREINGEQAALTVKTPGQPFRRALSPSTGALG
jgi:hypothetical protein